MIGIAYIPVIHNGYRDFCDVLTQAGGSTLYLVGDDVLEAHAELDYLNRKDRIRAIPQEEMARALSAITGLTVTVADVQTLRKLGGDVPIMMPNEDVSRLIAREYVSNAHITYTDIFLRWNRNNVGEDKVPAHVSTISADEFEKEIFASVQTEAARSFDWWRQVGAALVKGGEVIALAHNEHMPDEQFPNVYGDTRALFTKGERIEYVTSAHAEVAVLGEAAKNGIPTNGTELFLTDFPCPYCARLIAKSGIAKLYFLKGYAVLDGDVFLRDAGVEIVKVDI